MKNSHLVLLAVVVLVVTFALLIPLGTAGSDINTADLDSRVTAFLKESRGQWRDMNVPAVDGQTLHEIVLKHRYTRALEIGTSTGHSGTWIAWALAKTGGRLITIEIDEQLHRQAVESFKRASLSEFVDARLGDAHKIVPALEGPFDFIFSDADKVWYKNYLIALLPKLTVGGCYTTHNVGRERRANRQYVEYLLSLPNLETTFDDRGNGLSISYKRSE